MTQTVRHWRALDELITYDELVSEEGIKTCRLDNDGFLWSIDQSPKGTVATHAFYIPSVNALGKARREIEELGL